MISADYKWTQSKCTKTSIWHFEMLTASCSGNPKLLPEADDFMSLFHRNTSLEMFAETCFLWTSIYFSLFISKQLISINLSAKSETKGSFRFALVCEKHLNQLALWNGSRIWKYNLKSVTILLHHSVRTNWCQSADLFHTWDKYLTCQLCRLSVMALKYA